MSGTKKKKERETDSLNRAQWSTGRVNLINFLIDFMLLYIDDD